MQTEIKNILIFLKEVELLKSVTRHSWTSSGRQESVAEHSWRMALFAMVLEDHFQNLDMRKVIEMSLIHDLGEAHEGDRPAQKGELPNKLEIEEKSVKKIIEPLPHWLSSKILSLWNEYNECQTPEAQLVKALDKLEVLIQHNEADISTWDPEEYEYNLVYGLKEMNFNDFIKEFRKVVDERIKEKISKQPKSFAGFLGPSQRDPYEGVRDKFDRF